MRYQTERFSYKAKIETVALPSQKGLSVGDNHFLLPAGLGENLAIAGSWWEEADLDTEGDRCLCL